MTRLADHRWWESEHRRETLAARVVAAAHDVDTATTARQQAIVEAYALYGQAFAGTVAGIIPVGQRSGINVVAGAVDTLVAEVHQSETAPVVATVGGDWSERGRAKKLTAYCDALYEECEVQQLLRQATRDAIIAGLGIARPYAEGDAVAFERLHPLNVLVDDRACVDVLPRELYIRRAIDRRHLQALYPKHREAIDRAQYAPFQQQHFSRVVATRPGLRRCGAWWHLTLESGGE